MNFLFLRNEPLPPCSVQLTVECDTAAELFQALCNILMEGVHARHGGRLDTVREKDLDFLRECMQSAGITFKHFPKSRLVHTEGTEHLRDYVLVVEMFDICFRFDFYVPPTRCC